jgi:hypothetical protein
MGIRMVESLEDSPDEPSPAPSSVAHTVLDAFFKALGETDGYTDIAQRLRDTVIKKKSFAEAAVKTAIFGGDQS